MNNQPWRFLYALRNTPHWDKLFGLLVPGNQVWCKNAAALIVLGLEEDLRFQEQAGSPHSYDSGAAWVSLALQGSFLGFVVHGMQGFDYDRAKSELSVNDEFQVEAMIAVGRPGKKEDLPPAVREREFPSARKKLEELVFEGGFGS